MEKKREPLRCRSVAEDDSMSWREVAGLNEIIDVGCYVVQLKHGAGNDELPLPLCDQEHYVVGTLIVTESGTEKLQKNRVIGQTLILSQCNDGQTGIYYRSLAPVNSVQVWSEWNALLSTGQFNEIADGNTSITLDVKDNSVTAQKLSADVRKKVDSPLRPLYIAAGAEYNDSGADKTKTAPWGESVTHKAGHYYLNGLGDITEEQMKIIYCAPQRMFAPHAYSFQKARTVFCKGNGTFGALKSYECYYWFYSSNVETIAENNYSLFLNGENTLISAFNGCTKLKYINCIIYCQNCKLTNTFKDCYEIVNVCLERVSESLSFAQSSYISKDSIKYAIENARVISAITITLHPDAYARLKDDVDIVAALEAQPLISLVSA